MSEKHPFGPGSHAPLEDPNEMPDCYPVKGNDDSMLYHRPDSRSYKATGAEVWFVSPAYAEAAGFKLAGSHPKDSSSADYEPGAENHPCTAAQISDLGIGPIVHPYGPGSHVPLADAREMPDCYPIKGNVDSMLFHRPDSFNYGATIAEVWFVSPSAAEAAGFTLSSTHPKDSSSADFELGGSGHPCTADQFAALSASADDADQDAGSSTAGAAAAGAVGATAGVAALADLGDDETISSDAAADIRETVQVPKAANADAAASDKADAAKTDAGKADSGGDDDLHPFGPGSHAPLADVHEMPECHPIKGNADSMKYHRPDSQGYPKTKAEVWFVSPSVAEAAGFVMAGSHPEGSSSADFEPGGSGHPCSAAEVDGLGLPGGTAAVAGVAAGVAAAAAAPGFDAEETVIIPAKADDLSDDDTAVMAKSDDLSDDDTAVMGDADEQPFGLGSHAPLADVHEMPACHPIKGNADSMKYHRPDSQGYEQTKAEVWFVSPSVAEAAGFVLAGSHPEGSSSADFEPGGSGHPCTAEQLDGIGLGALGFAGAGVAAAAVAGTAAVAGVAALAGDDDTVDKAAEEKRLAEERAAAEAKEAEKKAAAAAKAEKEAAEKKAKAEKKAAEDKAKAEKKAAEDKAKAEKKAAAAKVEEVDKGISGKGVAAAAAGAAAVAGAAAFLGDDDDDETKAAADVRETVRNTGKDTRETVRETTKGGVNKAAAAAGTVGAVGAAGAAKVAAGRGGGDDDDDRGVAAAGGGWGWLKWLLPLLLLLGLLALLFWACSGSDDGGSTVAAAPDPTAVPDPTATPEPDPTATPEPDPTATPEPDPTATPEPEPEPEPEPTAAPLPSCNALVGVLGRNDFSTLVTAAGLADVTAALSDSGPLTIFAPTDEAFAAVPAEITAALLGDSELLASVLQYHVVAGAVTSGDLSASSVPTLNGSSLAIRTDGAAPTINASGITVADLEAGECVIHGLDNVLVPASLLTTLGVDSLNAAVGGAPITFVDGTADFTDADSATLAAICNYVATEDSTDGLPPIRWQSSGDADLDAQRAAAIEDALASCGPGGLTFSEIAPEPSFTG